MTEVYTVIYTIPAEGVSIMETAKIFENGRSQAVRLPKEFRFDADEVYIAKIGEVVLLMKKSDNWDSLLNALEMFSGDYMDGYDGTQIQEREEL